MDIQKMEDVKDTALKLEKIREECPENYFYLKGWIHCLLQKEEGSGGQTRRSAQQLTADLN